MTQYQIDIYIEDSFFSAVHEELPITQDKWRSHFQKWLQLVNNDLNPAKEYEISLVLTNDQEIQELNNQFRHKNKPTDVLAFASLDDEFDMAEVVDCIPLGDIIISVETAKRQAKTQQHSLETELLWLASHGFLHLLGWDHPDDESLNQMLAQQQKLVTTN